MRRRSFLAATAALAAAGTLGPLARRAGAAAAPHRYDLIVVGAGTAGLPAAIFAARRGARVLLLDAAAATGGTLHLSTGQMSAAGTKLQAAKGIADSPQAHYEDVMRICRSTADPDIVRLAVEQAGPTFDWLVERGLVPLPDHPILGAGHEPYTVRRYYWAEGGGRAILAVLERELQPLLAERRIELRLSTPVTALLTSDAGAVEGVRVQSGDREQLFLGRHVLLACGGYASNAGLFEALNGYRDYADVSYPYSQGAGITLGVSVGGYVRGRENYLCNFGSILADERYPAKFHARFVTVPQQRLPWEIYVNVRGERFVREDEPSVDAREHALLGQPDLRYWIVFDEAILAAAPPGVGGWTRERMRAAFDAHPMFARAASLEALAGKAGIDPAGLVRTVERYNAAVASGRDALGRRHLPRPIRQAPFYAIRHQGHSATSTVGLAVDRELRVVRAGGSPVPNLYAAGELLGSGQTMGHAFVGGMMVTPALAFGRLLGRTLPLGSA